MKQDYTKKVIVSTLAVALLLSGGALYGARQMAHAAAVGTAVQPDGGSGDTGKTSRFRSWFGKKEDARKDDPSGDKQEKRGFPILEEAAVVLGLGKDELKAALKDKTIAQIAAEKGISEADLIARLQTERSKRIDEAVKAGKLTSAKADKLKQSMPEHLKFMVNHKFDGGGYHGKHGPMGGKMLPAPDKLAALIGITPQELEAQLNAGKSLAEIAAAKGIGKDQLISKIKDEMTPWIENMVERKGMHKTKELPEKAPAPSK
ncbi:hypothetical protein O9H85_02620 [Paenibacillus filicis]|uniref:LysM domain-containing protein n=1 Tax=Paenibacillus gyeongsangnamensis TaxID=3388067 RepID=A0ABT4Q388_9BACL|nr:hypothetical protein [Paenibacillus filicis]MCZ8511347.1 hypothetical protein [Paenibacillus filicis]